jgi:hypothetical protein
MPTPKKVKTRTNLLGRNVKITREGSKKTREVQGTRVSKYRSSRPTEDRYSGLKGNKVIKSKVVSNPRKGSIDVMNMEKTTGLLGLSKVLDSDKKTKRIKSASYHITSNPSEISRKKKRGENISESKANVRQTALKYYRGSSLPKNTKA